MSSYRQIMHFTDYERKSLGGYVVNPLHIINLVAESINVNCSKDLILFRGTLFTKPVFAILNVSKFSLLTVFCKYFIAVVI